MEFFFLSLEKEGRIFEKADSSKYFSLTFLRKYYTIIRKICTKNDIFFVKKEEDVCVVL